MTRAWIPVARLLLGALYLWSGAAKVRDLHAFAEEVANYQLLPGGLVPWFAATLPGIELLVGALLVMGVWTRASALLASALLGVFVVALTQALARGINLRCGCFGGSDVATWGTVLRDVVLLAPALALAWRADSFTAREGAPTMPER